jgi:hypothetical protein
MDSAIVAFCSTTRTEAPEAWMVLMIWKFCWTSAGIPGRVHQAERLVLGQPLAEELRRRAHAAEVAAAQRDPCRGEPRHSTPCVSDNRLASESLPQ